MKIKIIKKTNKIKNIIQYIAFDENTNISGTGKSEGEAVDNFKKAMSLEARSSTFVELYKTCEVSEGYWWDKVYKKDKEGNVYLAETTEVKKNLIVSSFKSILAGLLGNEPTFTGGILYHAIGEGETSWDVSLPSPVFEDTTLTNEYYRQEPDDISYKNSLGNPVSLVEDASTILIKTTFGFETPTHPVNNRFIRTQGLVAGKGTSSINTGLLVDIINHKGLYKDVSVQYERFIEIRLG